MDPNEREWVAMVSPEAAMKRLREVSPVIRKAGDLCFQEGEVALLESAESGARYQFEVWLDGLQQVELTHEPSRDEWRVRCDCGLGDFDIMCAHSYAAIKAAVVLSNQAEVQQLSAGGRGRVAPGAVEDAKPVETFDAMAVRVLGRKLTSKESTFFRRLSDYRMRLRFRPVVQYADLNELGIVHDSLPWKAFLEVKIPVGSDREFWNLIAYYLKQQKLRMPEFMEPLTDTSAVEQLIAQAERREQIKQWQTLLTRSQQNDYVETSTEKGIELRLRITPSTAVLEWRNAGTEKYLAIKPSKFHDFETRYASLLPPDMAMLWQGFAPMARSGFSIDLGYHDSKTSEIINRALRLPALAQFIVGESGEPIERVESGLKWNLTPPESIEGDYHLQLVREDGTPLKHVLLKMPGRPQLFLTPNAVYSGPQIPNLAFDPLAETRIPALALESRDGIRFLQQIQAPIPERLASRVQSVLLIPVVRAEITAPYAGNESEYCFVDLLGEDPDGGVRERWNGHQWSAVTPSTATTHGDATAAGSTSAKPAQTSSADPAMYEILDRSQLGPLPRLVEACGFKWDYTWQRWSMRLTKKFPETFVPFLKSIPPTARVDLRGELASFLNAEISGEVRLDVQESGIDWFDLKVLVKVSDTDLTKAEIKLLLEARGKWVRLGEKGWRKLEFKLSKEEDAELARLGLNPHQLTSEPQRLHALQLADPAARRFLSEEKFQRVQRRAQEIQTRVKPAVPASVRAELRPYQLEGFHFLAYLSSNRFGGVLADDMGLGKTLQTLTWLAWLRDRAKAKAAERAANVLAAADGEVAGTTAPGTAAICEETGLPMEIISAPPLKGRSKSKSKALGIPSISSKDRPSGPLPSLVVCPKSVCDNWRAESERFIEGLKVRVWGTDDVKSLPALIHTVDLHIINYAQLRTVGEDLARLDFQVVILDEGQYIKNPSSMTAAIARTMRSEHRLVLSGTPVENRLMDLWSLMSFAMPGALGGRAEFSRLYDSKGDPFARSRLAARVRPFLLRRTKSQVAKDLPDRVEEDLYCELEGDQKLLYKAELKRAQQTLLGIKTSAALNKERFNVLTSLLRLRQICCHPKLLAPESKAPSAKVEALLETLEPLMEDGQKVLVFSQFVSALELLEDTMKENGWKSFFLAGETEDRGELVRQFQKHEGAAVFLISLKAGGFGLNLTASNYVVLFDPWWNPAVENQAIDRTHRIGQTQKVIAYRLLIKDSIEEKIRNLQRTKSDLAESVLGEERFAQDLTLDDLRFLFSD